MKRQGMTLNRSEVILKNLMGERIFFDTWQPQLFKFLSRSGQPKFL